MVFAYLGIDYHSHRFLYIRTSVDVYSTESICMAHYRDTCVGLDISDK